MKKCLTLYNNKWRINNIKAILLDKDGTFLDDHIYWGKLAENRIKKIISHFNLNKDLYSELCFRIGYNPETCKLIRNGAIGVLSRSEVVDHMVKELEKYNIQSDFQTISGLFNEVHKDFISNIEKYVQFIEYSKEFIENVRKSDIKLAVVTSDTYEHTLKILKILKIEKYFDYIVGKDSCEYDKKTGKPALLALDYLNMNPSDAIAIGDTPTDYYMSINSNLKTCILTATGQVAKSDLNKYTKYTVDNLSEVGIE